MKTKQEHKSDAFCKGRENETFMIIDPTLKLQHEEEKDICNTKAFRMDDGNMKTKYIAVRTGRASYSICRTQIRLCLITYLKL
jgi:hypothetical protein